MLCLARNCRCIEFQDHFIGIIGSYACLTSLSDASDLQWPPFTIVQMANRPTGDDEAIEFVWNQPDTVLEKQSLSAILAKETDVVKTKKFSASQHVLMRLSATCTDT